MPRTTSARQRSPFGARILGPREQEPRRLRIRIQLLLTVVLVSTNLLGAGVVFVVNNFAVPAPELEDDMKVALAIGVPTYVFAAAVDRRRLGDGDQPARVALGDPGRGRGAHRQGAAAGAATSRSSSR